LTGAARQGVDRIAQEREAIDAKARAMSVDKFIELYLARRVRGRLRSAPTMERILCRVLRPLASMPAADVRKRDLLPLFESIASAGHERAAGRARQIVGGLCKWGVSVDILTNDPTTGLPSYDLGQARDRVLSEDEIRLLWPWFETLPSAIGDALRVQLLTGARIGEVSGMTVEEIDRGKWLWTLPAARSKNKRSRTTPIVGFARTIIEARISEGPLFVSDNRITLTAHRVASALLLRRSKFPIEVFTSHDLRRTAATLMHENGIARDLIGAIVGHGSEDGKGSRTLIKHYLKSDLIERKTRALDAWDAQLKAIITNEPTDNVVHLRQGASNAG
jgi:integrase